MKQSKVYNNVETSENNIFFGDNLAIMSNSSFADKYKEKVKFIYIDPPYNTNNTFSFKDSRSTHHWKEFIKERILLSKQLLTEDGVIFISIDDCEFSTLREICDDVFEKKNCIGTFITYQSQRSNSKLINTIHEYVVCYSKNISMVKAFQVNRMDIPKDKQMIDSIYEKVKMEFNQSGKQSAEKLLKKIINEECDKNNISWLKNYSNISDDGKIYFAKDLSTPGKPRAVSIPDIGLYLDPLATRGWSSDKKFIELHKKNRLTFRSNRPYEVHYLEESKDNAPSILNFYSRFGTNDLKKLGIHGVFDTPKPVEMIKYFLTLATSKNDIVMDFFAGCGTTAQAVCEANMETNKNLKYVLIQLDEEVNKNTEVYKSCIKFGIRPNHKDILIYRLNKYLEMSKQHQNYHIYD